MATVTLLVPGPSPSPHRQVTLTTVDGMLSMTIPCTAQVGLDGMAARWADLQRPGRVPLTGHVGAAQVGAQIEVILGQDLDRSCEWEFDRLARIANYHQPVVVALGQISRLSKTGSWVITDMATVDRTELVQGSNEFARMRIQLTLRAAATPAQASLRRI